MTNPLIKTSRLDVVDALRGFALLAIVILHNLEHYNIYFFPENQPSWLNILDKGVWDTMFFIFAGKAYATFSLLFGFSFFIQMRNERNRGGDFRARFAWRMFLLFLFSQIHALFYNGDILLLYAVVGLCLIPICNLKDKTILIIAAVCLLQPFEIFRLIYSCVNPDYVISNDFLSSFVVTNIDPVVKGSSFLELLRSNIFDGQIYSNYWQVTNGRLFQTASLFMIGMILGRKSFFVKSETSIRNWKRLLIYTGIVFVFLLVFSKYTGIIVSNKSSIIPFNIIVSSLRNSMFMAVLVSIFTLVWFKTDGLKWQRFIIPYGRMSLTNYITQSIIGVIIYYGAGLGLYQYTGATATVLIGIMIFTAQLIFSKYWLSRHKQGPLEYLWWKATWIKL